LKGSANWRDYGHEGALLFAKNATGLSISGEGILDGSDRAVWQRLADEEAGGDVTKADWWPQAFCGDWWPFGKKPGEVRKTYVLSSSLARLPGRAGHPIKSSNEIVVKKKGRDGFVDPSSPWDSPTQWRPSMPVRHALALSTVVVRPH
jgi:hypothetical protein